MKNEEAVRLSESALGERAGSAAYDAFDIEQWLHMYEQMQKIRLFEEQVNELYKTAKMPGLAHLYCGQEAVAVGVCEALQKEDTITSTHRGHGHCLAKGASIDRMYAELLGRAPGYCMGKGGSMHIADQESGNLGANAIVGAGAGLATGAALSIKLRHTDQVAAAFFGEGALGQGLIYEVMNMASLWKLPVLYICENNLYSEYTFYKETAAGELLARPRAFDILAEEVDGQDVRQVHLAARRLVARARGGEGPAFLLCNTYRYYGHHVGDINRAYYRSKEEEERWKSERDPIQLLGRWLLAEKQVPGAILSEIEGRVRLEITQAVEFALQAPFPDVSEVSTHVYA
jgi:pyruvate dehydrogenase E1 component alpha subunit